jgi:hypothetical protein
MVIIWIFKESIFDDLGSFSDWVITHPYKGTFFFFLLYVFGMPLTFPTNLIIIFGSYAYTRILGLVCNN